MKSAWFNNLENDYQGNESTFFKNKNNTTILYIESKTLEFKAEIEKVIAIKTLNFSDHYATDMYEAGGWSTICLKTWGIDVPSNRKKFPELSNLLDKFPELLSLSINKLKAGKKINAHIGNTDAIWRFHLGIDIPKGLPECGFKVNGESVAWKNSEAFGFCDAYEHEAWNNSESDRIIICFDIIKDEFKSRKMVISFKVRSLLILHYLVSTFPFLSNFPKFMLKTLLFFILLIVIIIYPYQKYFGVIKRHD